MTQQTDLDDLRPSYKKRKSFKIRHQEAQDIRAAFPDKIAVIVERHGNERTLPPLDKSKYLVPHDTSMREFSLIIRNRMMRGDWGEGGGGGGGSKTLFLLVDNRLGTVSRLLLIFK